MTLYFIPQFARSRWLLLFSCVDQNNALKCFARVQQDSLCYFNPPQNLMFLLFDFSFVMRIEIINLCTNVNSKNIKQKSYFSKVYTSLETFLNISFHANDLLSHILWTILYLKLIWYWIQNIIQSRIIYIYIHTCICLYFKLQSIRFPVTTSSINFWKAVVKHAHKN